MSMHMCMLCSVDPNTASLIVPIAQATLISTPILLRHQLRRGASQVRAWRRGDGIQADEPAIPDDEPVTGETAQPDG
jgi:hypothetical protein